MKECDRIMFVLYVRTARTRVHSLEASIYKTDEGWDGHVHSDDDPGPCFVSRNEKWDNEDPEYSREWIRHHIRYGKIVYLVTWNVCPICGNLIYGAHQEEEAEKVRRYVGRCGRDYLTRRKRFLSDEGRAYLLSVAKKYENRRPMKYHMCGRCRAKSNEERAEVRAKCMYGEFPDKDKDSYLETKALCRKRKPKPTTKTEYKVHAKKAIARRCRRKQITRSEQIFFSMMLGAKKFVALKHYGMPNR